MGSFNSSKGKEMMGFVIAISIALVFISGILFSSLETFQTAIDASTLPDNVLAMLGIVIVAVAAGLVVIVLRAAHLF